MADMSDVAIAMLVVVTGAGFVALFLLVPLWGPDLVYRGQTQPVNGPEFREAGSFSLVDMLSMVVLLALANLVVTTLSSEVETWWIVIMAVIANALAWLIWTKCRSFMLRRGVSDWRARALVQLLLYPLSIYTIGLLVFTTILLLECVCEGRGEEGTMVLALIAVIGLVVGVMLVVILRALFQWCLSVSRGAPELEC
ncbi:MAG: hypothetical protein U0795_11680 [Pirellulales bacterium]